MPKQHNKEIRVKNGVDPNYLVNLLTKDVTVMESIFDIVDNALDVARDHLWQGGMVKRDDYGLPRSYEGSRIEIEFGKGFISFADNCGGIAEPDLQDKAFVIGELSQHDFGIGRFGIGMKRTLFRLGSKYRMETDTGAFAASMDFGESDLGNSDTDLVAVRTASRGTPGTLFRVEELRQGVGRELSSDAWSDELRQALSRRYGIFLAKGFEIWVNNEPVFGFGPGYRTDTIIQPQSQRIPIGRNIVAYVESGLHEDFRFKDEDGYSNKVAKSLTDQFGWYFVCNDRIVEVASHERSLGWTTKWHQEYYGFIGWVRFVARDPESLPWDTKKSSIDPHSLAFREIINSLQAFAEDFKKNKKILIKPDQPDSRTSSTHSSTTTANQGTRGQAAATSAGSNTATTKTAGAGTGTGTGTGSGGKKPSTKDHNEYWDTLLPSNMPSAKHDKIRALVFEAMTLQIKICYSGSMLFRGIIEAALMEHLKGTRSYKSVKQMVFDEAAADNRPFAEEKKKKYRPSLSEALQWLNRNDDYFPEERRTDCTMSRNKFKKHLQELNGIVHDGDLTNSGKLATIRDDTMALLRFLLESV